LQHARATTDLRSACVPRAGTLKPIFKAESALRERHGSGAYWYGRHYGSPRTPQVEDFVCKQNDLEAYDAMWHRT